MTDLPLQGVTVLEFSHTVMGPACGMILADMGADVIRVEPSPDGDPTRTLRGFATGFFAYFNRNKRSICIDLRTPEGLGLVRELLDEADVLVENFGPGAFDRLGLGWDELSKIQPRLIYCSLKGYLPGPYGNRPATDEIIQHMVGLPYMTGPEGMPLRTGTSIMDIAGGMMGATGIIGALRLRDADGKGRQVSTALFETGAFLMGQSLSQEAATGKPALPMPVRSSAWAIYEIFPTKGGEPIFVGIIRDKHWTSFCRAFGLEHHLQDPRFVTNAERVRHKAAVKPIVEDVTKAWEIAALCEKLEKADIPFAPVRRPSDLFSDPQLEMPGRMLDTEIPGGILARLPALPILLDGQSFPLRCQTPGAGEHTDEIMQLLGHSGDKIDALRRAQIIA